MPVRLFQSKGFVLLAISLSICFSCGNDLSFRGGNGIVEFIVEDLNGDSLPDIAVFHFDNDKNNDFDILLNNQESIFSIDRSFNLLDRLGTFAFFIEKVFPVDVDNDGDIDLAIVTRLLESEFETAFLATQILLNDGNANFSPSQTIKDLSEFALLKDFDGDGFLDFVDGDVERNNVVLFRNQNGTFPETPALFPLDLPKGTALQFATASDLDQDEDLDLNFVVVGENQTEIITLTNDGTGQFDLIQAPLVFNPNKEIKQIAVGDFNQDQAPDLVLNVRTPNKINFDDSEILILENDGTGLFLEANVIFEAKNSLLFGLTVQELNNDVQDDIFFEEDTDEAQSVTLLLNQQNGDFQEQRIGLGEDLVLNTEIADFKNDGTSDLIFQKLVSGRFNSIHALEIVPIVL